MYRELEFVLINSSRYNFYKLKITRTDTSLYFIKIKNEG